MVNKLTAKERRRVVLTSILCFFIIGLSVISSIDNVTKLQDEDYVLRYAREKYLYSKNGEKILKID